MSKGLGKLQREILALIRKETAPLRRAPAWYFTTSELFGELQVRGLLGVSRKTAMSAVRRACAGLVLRGMIECLPTLDRQGRKTYLYSAKE